MDTDTDTNAHTDGQTHAQDLYTLADKTHARTHAHARWLARRPSRPIRGRDKIHSPIEPSDAISRLLDRMLLTTTTTKRAGGGAESILSPTAGSVCLGCLCAQISRRSDEKLV
jgi:hypothetical protein